MKWLVYLLLLANITLFAWLRLETAPADLAVRTEHIPAGVARLVLLDEVPEKTLEEVAAPPEPESIELAQTDAVDAETSKPKENTGEATVVEEEPPEIKVSETRAEPIVVYQCHRLAGLESSNAADRLAGKFKTWGIEVLARGTEQVKQKSYWVMLPAFKSRQDAQTVIKRLKAAGFSDQYLIPSGVSKNVLSLGVFSTPEAAKRHRARIMALKLEGITSPKIEEIGLPSKRYWMKVRLSESEAAIPWQKEVAELKAEAETIACPD